MTFLEISSNDTLKGRKGVSRCCGFMTSSTMEKSCNAQKLQGQGNGRETVQFIVNRFNKVSRQQRGEVPPTASAVHPQGARRDQTHGLLDQDASSKPKRVTPVTAPTPSQFTRISASLWLGSPRCHVCTKCPHPTTTTTTLCSAWDPWAQTALLHCERANMITQTLSVDWCKQENKNTFATAVNQALNANCRSQRGFVRGGRKLWILKTRGLCCVQWADVIVERSPSWEWPLTAYTVSQLLAHCQCAFSLLSSGACCPHCSRTD